MSAIDELVRSYHDSIGVGECEITDNARAELAALRQRVSELEASRSELMAELAAFGNADAPNAQPATLTPRKCGDCNPLKPDVDSQVNFRRGIDAAWDAAYTHDATREVLNAIKAVILTIE